jgi:hypothetical protein
MTRIPLIAAALSLVLAAGCSRPPPDPDAPPDPQASALNDAIQRPIDKAEAVEETDAQRQAERDEALEAAGV